VEFQFREFAARNELAKGFEDYLATLSVDRFPQLHDFAAKLL